MRGIHRWGGLEEASGLRLYVHRFRDESVAPSGTTVLLLHGYMDAGGTWDLLAPYLARAGHDVVAPDLRGFGASDAVGAGGYYHFPDYVADVAKLVDRLAPARLAVVGHSMGGTVATLYAGAQPQRVWRLALIEGVGTLGSEPEHAVDRMGIWLDNLRALDRSPRPVASMDEAVSRLGKNHPRVPIEILRTRAPLLTRTDPEGRLFWAYDPLHRTRSPTPFHLEAFRGFLRRIACPTLFVGGGPLGWHPPDEEERVALLRDVRTVDIPGAGHMVHWTAPEALAGALVPFLDAGAS